MGRPKKFEGIVNKYFQVALAQSGGKGLRYKCSFCYKMFAKNFYRMVKHLLDCPHTTEHLKKNERSIILNLFDSSNKSKKCNKQKRENKLMMTSSSEDSDELESDMSELSNFAISNPQTNTDAASFVSTSASTSRGIRKSNNRQQGATKSTNDLVGTTTSFGNQSTLNLFVDHIQEEEQKTIWTLISRALYASGAPLSLLEHSYWKQTFKKIRPSLKLPTRYHLSTTLLEEEYKRINNLVEEQIRNSSYLSIQLDGWSNIRLEPVVNVIVTTPEPVILKIINTDVNSHTGEYMAQIIEETINDVGVDKVIAVITDNAKNMEKARSLIKASFPNRPISCYGCAAHILNLLAQDVSKLEPFAVVAQRVKDIVKKIKCSHLVCKFQHYQSEFNCKKSLKLPVSTRWASLAFSLESILHNKQPLQHLAISEDTKDMDTDIVSTILDHEFWLEVKALFDLLFPILKWITLLEANQCRLPFVIEAFEEIGSNFNDVLNSCTIESFRHQRESLFQFLENRKNKALNAIHKAAHLLNPRSKGKLLNGDDFVEAVSYLTDVGNAILDVPQRIEVASEIASYKSNSGLWKKQFVWNSLEPNSEGNSISPLTWWQGICGNTSLSKIATAILQCPATTAQTERTFSTASFIQNKRRNRLTNEKSAKLVYIKHNLQMMNSLEESCTYKDPHCASHTFEYVEDQYNALDGLSDDDDDEEAIILQVVEDEEEAD